MDTMITGIHRGMRSNTRTPATRERGAALIISLVFLTALTLLGIAAMQGTTLQEKMAGNTAQQNRAFQRAEAALNDGLNDILTDTPNISAFDTSLPRYDAYSNPSPDPFNDTTWTSAYNVVAGDDSMLWYVEILHPDRVQRPERGCNSRQGCEIRVFRVTARGTAGNSQVVLRGVIGRE